jgi:ABC-type branched-subunit amino acid transport system substrate-binding protein
MNKLRIALALLTALSASWASGQDLVVGQVASQTSPVTAANSKGMAAGMKVYFDQTNAQGGINGRKVRLVTKDDQLKPGVMVEMTKEFVADKEVLALAGYVNTGGLTELAKANLPGEAGIALISPLQGDKSIVGAANIFPFRSGYPDEVQALIKEAAQTQKKRVAIVYWNVTFGPAIVPLAREWVKKDNLSVAAWVSIDATPAAADRFDAIMKEAVAQVVRAEPDAVIMLISGRFSLEFVKQIKASTAADAQLYGMSILNVADLIKTAGEAKVRGIVIAQAVPFPFSATLPVVSEYQKLMKMHAPAEPLSFATLEGFVAAKITVEALKRAGPRPTREKVLKALTGMGEHNLGGVYVNYTSQARDGWGGVDLTIVGNQGKLLR